MASPWPLLGSGADVFRGGLNSVYLDMHPEKSRIAAGLAMGNLWAACEGISEGDMVLAPKPDRTYQYGVVTGGYEYHAGTDLPHRRRVDWKSSLRKDDMSPTLASSAGSLMTVFQLAAHTAELATLTQLTDAAQPIVQAISSQVEDQLAFQMEKQLEDFLVHNGAALPSARRTTSTRRTASRWASSTRPTPGRWTSSPSARTGPGSLSLS